VEAALEEVVVELVVVGGGAMTVLCYRSRTARCVTGDGDG